MHQVAYSIFGYARGELEDKNVSILMPQPFSSKHDGFLHNYLATGQAKILNSMRDVVALKKVRGHVCCRLDLQHAILSCADTGGPQAAVLTHLCLPPQELRYTLKSKPHLIGCTYSQRCCAMLSYRTGPSSPCRSW